MTAPGQYVISATVAPSRGLPTRSGTVFATGLFEQGPAGEPILCRNMSEVIEKFGGRVSWSQGYDWCEAAFAEGVKELWLSRTLGPAFKFAELIVKNGAEESLKIKGKTPGEWANGPSVAGTMGLAISITSPGGEKFVIHVFQGGKEVSESPVFNTQAEAVAWQNRYVQVTIGTGVKPPTAVAETNLAGGKDEHAAVTETNWEEALNAFSADLGPGQVVQIGRTTNLAFKLATKHCAARNRFAVCDFPNIKNSATLSTQGEEMRIDPNARYGAGFAPWIQTPGLIPGATREVPPSALVCGRIASVDAKTENPNAAAAGGKGGAEYALGVTQTAWTDEERDKLNKTGVMVIRNLFGQPVIFGYRTFVNPVTEPTWLDITNARLFMVIASKISNVGGQFAFAQIDAKGKTTSRLATMIKGELLPYFEKGALYGESPSEAFNVQTGANVNTIQTAEAKELLALVSLKMSEFGEVVTIALSKQPLSGSVV